MSITRHWNTLHLYYMLPIMALIVGVVFDCQSGLLRYL
jgi:hypothetical protein